MYDEIFRRYKCGVLVSSPAEIPSALASITQYYDEYSAGAKLAYKELYDPEGCVREIMATFEGNMPQAVRDC